MKKRGLWTMFFLTTYACFCITPVAAQESKDFIEIKNVLETFINEVMYGNINSAMQFVSVNFSSRRKDSGIVDYATFKSLLEKRAQYLSLHFDAPSLINVVILESDIQDNKAICKVEDYKEAFNFDTLKAQKIK